MLNGLNTIVQSAPLQAGFNRVFKSRRTECRPHLNERQLNARIQAEREVGGVQEGDCDDLSARLQPAAEKELAAFAKAVEELFGLEQAHESINDWIEEVAKMDWSNGEPSSDWRAVTIAAAARLANRQ